MIIRDHFYTHVLIMMFCLFYGFHPAKRPEGGGGGGTGETEETEGRNHSQNMPNYFEKGGFIDFNRLDDAWINAMSPGEGRLSQPNPECSSNTIRFLSYIMYGWTRLSNSKISRI